MGSLADFSTKPRTKSVHSASSKCFMSSCLLARQRPTPSREERKSYLGSARSVARAAHTSLLQRSIEAMLDSL